MTGKKFEDIEVSADLGWIRLYTSDEDYEDYDGDEVLDMLNNQHEEIQQLKLELDTYKHPLWSTREAERKVNELTELLDNEVKKNAALLDEINSLRIENMRLKELKE